MPSKSHTKRRRKPKKTPPLPPTAPPPDDVSTSDPIHVDQTNTPANNECDDEAKTLEWLTGAFASASIGEVESAFREAQGDAFRAAGILLGRGIEKRKGAARKQKKTVAATGMVSNVIGKGYGSGRTGSGAVEKGWEERREREMEMVEFLFGMMGERCELDVGVIRDVLGHCGHDVEKAIDKLLEISSSTSSLFKSSDENDYEAITKMFLDLPHEELALELDGLEDKLSVMTVESSSGTSENDNEYQHPELYEHGKQTPLLRNSEEQWINKQELQQKVLLSLFSLPDYSQREPKLMDWKKVVKKVESFGQGLEFSVALGNDNEPDKMKAKEDIYETFRGAARQHWDMMRSHYHRAAVAYSKGDRAHASYLSDKGNHFSKLAREADEKASREIFEARNRNIQNEITIDLHGQHVKQAIGLLKLHLLIFTYTPSIQLLRVITGCGSHGVGKGKLKLSVIKLAEKEGIQWREENAGALLLKIDKPKVYSFIESDDGDMD